jgi:hypothetical protein
MPNPMIRIHNTETDEVIDREMTAEEFAEWKESQKAFKAVEDQKNAELEAKQAILDRLGITAEEAQLLLS